MGIKERLEDVLERIEKACTRAGRKPEEVRLIAVTKTFPRDVVEEAIALGVKEFGENYVQEAYEKFRGLGGITLHMIGHLQRNKVKRALEIFHMIQSLDSLKLAQEIEKKAERKVPCLVQVNIGLEKTKSGVSPDEVLKLMEELNRFDKIDVKGFMTIPPYTRNQEELRRYFSKMRELLERANAKGVYKNKLMELSMGMTEDFELAIEEGATMVRIGRGIFGERLK